NYFKEAFYDLVTIFSRYEEAKDSEKKVSQAELVEGTRYAVCTVGKIMHDMGLVPFYPRQNKRVVNPKDAKEALKRSANVPIPFADIAYFLDIAPHAARQNIT